MSLASKQAKSQTPKNLHPQAGTQLTLTLTKSLIGRPDKHRRIATALGLRKTNQTVTHQASPTIVGMVNQISHLLNVV